MIVVFDKLTEFVHDLVLFRHVYSIHRDKRIEIHTKVQYVLCYKYYFILSK